MSGNGQVGRSPSIRSRRVSGTSTPAGPLEVTIGTYELQTAVDSLPLLLSPSDHDGPLSLGAFSDTSSQAGSDDERSRFIRPGTPIQMQLPDMPPLLFESPLSGSIAEEDLTQEEFEAHPPDDDDIVGDKGRAHELLNGLERVPLDLIPRYERIRGDGHDICTICRDPLVDEKPEDTAKITGLECLWNVTASAELPFHNTFSTTSIHAFPCAHLFHTDCLFPWLCIKTTCPTCRLDIDPLSLTLRMRGWIDTPNLRPENNDNDPLYVNVDVLGRRIPWNPPPAPTLAEWMDVREKETPEERQERMRLRPSPRTSYSSLKSRSDLRFSSQMLPAVTTEDSSIRGVVVGFQETPHRVDG